MKTNWRLAPSTGGDHQRDGRGARTAMTLVCALGCMSAGALAADIGVDELDALRRVAATQVYAPVQMNLDVDVPLASKGGPSPALSRKIRALEDAALQQLSGLILPASVWRNGLGQIGAYVSAPGLEFLVRSNLLRGFHKDVTRGFRLAVHDANGELEVIEEQLRKHGTAEVQVLDNLEGVDFDVVRGGAGRRETAAWRDEAARTRPKFLAGLMANGVTLSGTGSAAGAVEGSTVPLEAYDMASPALRLRVDWNGYRYLLEHPEVRAISSTSAPATPGAISLLAREPVLDPEALREAELSGAASVTIDLHRFAGYSPLRSKLPAKAWRQQAAAIERAFDAILTPVLRDWRKVATVHEGFASLPIVLPADALRQLFLNPDPRIAAIRRNKPEAVAALKESTTQMNLPQVWAKYTVGAGQSIAVLDTGVDAAHPFLRDPATGRSKVWAEACLGTNASDTRSLCSPQDANGDAFGPGTGQSYPEAVGSNYLHGTHVAGIAVGDSGPGGLRGVAPGAKLIVGKVFSAAVGGGNPKVVPVDVAEALARIDALNQSNITVNLSITILGYWDRSEGPCNDKSPLTRDRIAALNAKGIPVVAATGNEGIPGKIGWPACVSGVIKVAAINDVTAELWGNSNLADPDKFSDPFFVAPGAGITSAIPGGRFDSIDGTSMATPHAAGLYALGKAGLPGYTVADLTAFLFANAVIPGPRVVIGMFPPEQRTVTLSRLRLRDGL